MYRPSCAVMSALTPLLLRGLTGPARRLLVPRAQVHSKPPREPLGTMVRSGPAREPRGGIGAGRVWRAGPPRLRGRPAPRRVAGICRAGLGVSGGRGGQCPGHSLSVGSLGRLSEDLLGNY